MEPKFWKGVKMTAAALGLMVFACIVCRMWFKLFNEWTTPMVALAALGIIVYFVHFKGQKTWEVGGKAVSIVKTVLMFIGVFYLMQVICGLVFGANLQSLYEGVGARTPLGPFMSPE